MIRMAWKRIWNRKLISIISILAMVAVFTVVPLGIYYAKESKLAVEHTIEEHGRGLYDILVRPAGSRTHIEKELGVVEANYIGDSSGGISIKEWEEIKNHPDIEIAAPVASIGYFNGNINSVGLPLLKYPAIITWNYYTSDGLNKYPLDDPFSVYYFEGKENEFVDFIVNMDALHFDSKVVGFMGAKMPRNYYLLTAIDVETEGKLTGIDFTDLNKYDDIEDMLEGDHFERFSDDPETLKLVDSLKFRGKPKLIPVLQRNDLNIPLYINIDVKKLDIQLLDYKKKFNLHPKELFMDLYNKHTDAIDELINELNHEQIVSTENHEIDLSQYQSPFDGNYVKITEDFKVEWGEGGSLTNDSSLYFVASKINYELSTGQVKVPIVKEGSPPQYKEVIQKGESYFYAENFEVPFMLWQTGTFIPPKEENDLISSPLGIYSTEEVLTRDGVRLTPTITPGSFIAQPAAGVTTIEAAEFIKGDKPIDAVRIRIAGIESYNQAAQDKINRVAIDLLEMGYEVDIVAGSSFKQLEMEVEGIGQVTAPWTTLGTAQSLIDGWNALVLISSILFALFGITWFIAKLIYEKNTFAVENNLLATIGWEENKIKLRNFIEQFTLVTLAFLLSIGILTLVNQEIILTYLLISIGIWVALVLLISIVFNYNSKPSNRVEPVKIFPGIWHYRQLILPVMFTLIISTILIIVQLTSLLTTLAEARVTTLGIFTMEQVYMIQLLLLISTFVIAIFSISEALKSLISERSMEFNMYFAIGWTKGMIQKHFSKEVVVWAGISVVIGSILSLIILALNELVELYLIAIIINLLILVVPFFVIIKGMRFSR